MLQYNWCLHFHPGWLLHGYMGLLLFSIKLDRIGLGRLSYDFMMTLASPWNGMECIGTDRYSYSIDECMLHNFTKRPVRN